MRPPHRFAVLLVSVLVAAGCSSADRSDGEPATPAPASASSSGTPSGDPTPAAGAGTEALDACDLLGPTDYKRFISPGLRDTASERFSLDGLVGSINTCTVAAGPFPLLRFGYSTDSDAWAVIRRRTRPDKVRKVGDKTYDKIFETLAQKRQDLPNIADEAFMSTGLGGNTMYALDDGVVYRLGADGLAGRKGLTLGDHIAVMITMLSNASAGVDREPVQLPPQCPAADSPEVVAAIGEVAHAFGAAYRGMAPSCTYTGADGRRLSAGATLFGTSAGFEQEAMRPERIDGVTMIDPLPGPTSGIGRDEGGWTYYAAFPARVETVTIHGGRLSWRPRPEEVVDRKALLTFVEAYRALATEQLGVAY